jgi:general secretion pathway protein F
MAEHPEVFPKLYVNMIRAGESGGIVDVALRYLVEYLERSLDLREDLKSALTYPVLLATVAGLSLTVLFVYVIPKFSLIFKDVRQALPWLSVFLLDFSDGLSRSGWIVLLLVIAGSTGGAFYVRNPEGRLQWDRWRLNLWVLGDLLRKLEVARFARTLAALLRGGVAPCSVLIEGRVRVPRTSLVRGAVP